jgi:hypothetical protein
MPKTIFIGLGGAAAACAGQNDIVATARMLSRFMAFLLTIGK